MFAKDAEGRVTLRATRLPAPLSLDGNLDEAVYTSVPPIDHFIQQEPVEGQPATERTLAWLFYDDERFYVSVRVFDSAPDRLVANELRRDNFNIFQNDNVTISIDPLYTRRSGVFFQTNALSAQRDQEIQDERSNNNDWNTIWYTRSRILDDGWSMEFAIPYSSLRTRGEGPQVWGFNLRRVVRWKNEHVSIAAIPASATVRAMYKFDIAATLVGVETPSTSRPIDFKPYGIAANTTNLGVTPVYRNDPSADAGFDVKYGLTSGLVADFTYRTDFAQVEEDQQQVNLTRFSLFFPEKRDFFLEGQGLFSFGGEQRGGGGGGQSSARNSTPSLTPVVFYSRRIGLGPSGGEVPIIAGGRVAGRAGKLGIGLLNIQTEEEEAFRAPSTNFSVVRLRRDVLRRSNVGMILTHRSPSEQDANTVAGVDANFWFFQNVTMTGFYAQSKTGDDSRAAMDRSSYRGEFEWSRRSLRPQVRAPRGGEELPARGRLPAPHRVPAQLRLGALQPAARGQQRHPAARLRDRVRLHHRHRRCARDARGQGRLPDGVAEDDQWSVDYSSNYEFLRAGFNVVPGMRIPAGAYHFGDVRATYVFGPQRRVSGNLSGGTGTFYDGTNTEMGARGIARSRRGSTWSRPSPSTGSTFPRAPSRRRWRACGRPTCSRPPWR